ncbi:hypothetical protein M405DRAFT_831333 [Rhizopogon salebrosus TDB-379]|nr:hypothetical protein M405DRAFT_831333 [Rhizopogon salebrosus TDB-379]
MLFPRHTLDRILDCFWPLSLTAHRCFQLAFGLLHRLRSYYSPPPMLIFLLSESSQAICWHATHFMVEVLGGLGSIVDDTSPTFSILTAICPDMCWAVIRRGANWLDAGGIGVSLEGYAITHVTDWVFIFVMAWAGASRAETWGYWNSCQLCLLISSLMTKVLCAYKHSITGSICSICPVVL